MSAVTEAFLMVAERFGPIFPMSPAKRPYTQHGSKDATKDKPTIIEWQSRWPDASPALLTGEPSGVVALDIDRKAGRDGIDTLEMMGIATHPASVTAHTPSGGLHILFRWPGHFVPTSNDRIGPGLEVKGDRGWITLPPGIGRSWDPILGPETELLPMPAWMMPAAPEREPEGPRPATTQRLSRYGEAALDGAVKAIIGAGPGAQEKTLNTEAFSIGRLAGGGAVPAGLALDSLLWAARRMPSHDHQRPWRLNEVERKTKAAFTDGLRQPRGVPDARR